MSRVVLIVALVFVVLNLAFEPRDGWLYFLQVPIGLLAIGFLSTDRAGGRG